MMIDAKTDPQTTPHDADTLAARPLAPNAVDDLALVRAQITALKSREADLCDEIRTCSTEQGDQRISGVAVDAIIETRRPRRIDMSKLPIEILSNPDMYRSDVLTHVLIWPKASAQMAQLLTTQPDRSHGDAQEPAHDAAADVTLQMPSDDTDAENGVLTTPDLVPEVTEMLEETFEIEETKETVEAETEQSAPTVTDLLAEDTVDLGLSTPSEPPQTQTPVTDDVSAEDAPADTAELQEVYAAQGEDSFEFESEAEITNIFDHDPRNIAPGPMPEQTTAASTDTGIGEQTTADENIPYLLTKAIARLTAKSHPSTAQDPEDAQTPEAPVAQTPVLDAIQEIVERPAPRDLKPTEMAPLQPLAGLHQEHVAAVLADAEAPLESAPLVNEIEEAHALEAKADALLARVDAGEDINDLRAPAAPNPYGFESDENTAATPASFASRRAASGDD